MQNKLNFKTSEKLIYDETNITETNALKSLFQILVKIIAIIFLFWFLIYFSSGIILNCLSENNKIKLENAITNSYVKKLKIKNSEEKRLTKIKALILEIDKNYPKTSKLNIGIMDSKQLNAFCLPNGTIYITSELYKNLSNDEMLTFIIAHEMAHYKHKDHLFSLRRSIASASIAIVVEILTQDKAVSQILGESIELSNLKYSRNAEKNADIYARNALIALYGTTKGGIDALKILDKNYKGQTIAFLSTHPDIKKRIKMLERFQ